MESRICPKKVEERMQTRPYALIYAERVKEIQAKRAAEKEGKNNEENTSV